MDFSGNQFCLEDSLGVQESLFFSLGEQMAWLITEVMMPCSPGAVSNRITNNYVVIKKKKSKKRLDQGSFNTSDWKPFTAKLFAVI